MQLVSELSVDKSPRAREPATWHVLLVFRRAASGREGMVKGSTCFVMCWSGFQCSRGVSLDGATGRPSVIVVYHSASRVYSLRASRDRSCCSPVFKFRSWNWRCISVSPFHLKWCGGYS